MQRNRLKRITLLLHRADNGRILIAESLKLAYTRLGLPGRDAGQQPAGGLRVEQQGIARVPGRPLHLTNGPPQPNILRLQGRKNALPNDLQRAGQERQPFHIEGHVNRGGADHFDQMSQQTESGYVGHGGCAVLAQAVRSGPI